VRGIEKFIGADKAADMFGPIGGFGCSHLDVLPENDFFVFGKA